MSTKGSTIYVVCILLLLIAGIISCKKDTKREEVEKIVTEWTGKEIVFPAGIQCVYLGHDTVCPDQDTLYKILLYTDSTGCTDCKLQLYKWNTLIKEAETIMSGRVSFHFYFQPKEENTLKFMMRRDDFRHIVYIDRQSKLHEGNKLPRDMSYQCFLLDKDNKVVLIGNPTLNPRIWDLYKEAIMEEISVEKRSVSFTTIEIERDEIELQNTEIHKPSIATFIIKNTGDVPLIIRDVSASCGCTVPKWDKKPIKPDEKTEIEVKVTPDVTGYFRKTVNVFCNTEEGVIMLSVKNSMKG